jgi:peptidoglycan/LPS O-acetylase OafA/YrhL
MLGLVSLCGLVVLVIVGSAETNAEIFGIWVLVSLCTAGVIASTQGPRTLAGRILSFRPMVQVGKMSYGVYLWHFPVLVSIDAMVGLDSIWPRVTGLAITAVVVVASYYLLELPFLRLKARVRPGDADSGVITSVAKLHSGSSATLEAAGAEQT